MAGRTLAGRQHAATENRFSLPPGTTAGEWPEPVWCVLAVTDGDRMLVRASSIVPVLARPVVAIACGPLR